MEVNFSFGYWLRRQRLARDLRQAELAAQLGIAPITLRKIEADDRRPSLQLIERVSAVFALDEQEQARLLQVARADLSPAALPLPERAVDLDLDRTPVLPAQSDTLPAGTLTFLFTDIEGSTRHWEQHPDAMRDALAQHNRLLQQAIAANDGLIVKHTGDGVLAVFTRCEDTVTAAVAAQRLLAANEWGTGDPLLVRMAIHTGTVELQGDDYIGPTLNRAARLLATGHGGQILLSLVAAVLVRDHMPTGVTLRDLGFHHLRDLSEPEQIFQVSVADLPHDFPMLQTLKVLRHNLPSQTTALIGREEDVNNVCRLVTRPDVRLLTLTGPGGAGKTRLAVQVATELLEQFPQGVWFVDLAPVSEAERVLEAIAHTLDVREMGGRPLRDTLYDTVCDQQMLLVLDNFEQVVDAAPEIALLLQSAPLLRIIVTSRTILRLRAEYVVDLPPLAFPEASRHIPYNHLEQYAAIKLFVNRVQAVRPGFAITPANASAIAAICRRLDGLPLAIELAAARVRLFSPEALLARLDQRLPLLTGGAHDLPLRQQSLRATIDWSYGLLSQSEQSLFCCFGVFEGGWDLDAAVAVAQIGSAETLELLTSLADKGLIHQSEGLDGDSRFAMLETLREYAIDQLEKQKIIYSLRRQHLRYYLEMVRLLSTTLWTEQRELNLQRLEIDHANIQVALQWCLLDQQESIESALDFVVALSHFWYIRGHTHEGIYWLEKILAVPTTEAFPLDRAEALVILGQLISEQDEYKRAIDLYEAGLKYYEEVRHIPGIVRTLNNLGLVYKDCGLYKESREFFSSCLTYCRSISEDEYIPIAVILTNVGILELERGNLSQAEEYLEEAATIFARDRVLFGVAIANNFIGRIALERGDSAEAIQLCKTSFEYLKMVGDQRHALESLCILARAAVYQGENDGALTYCVIALQYAKQLGYRRGIAECLELTAIAIETQRPVDSIALCSAAEALRARIGAPQPSIDQLLYSRLLERLRQQSTEGEWLHAWTQGNRLSVEEAVRLCSH